MGISAFCRHASRVLGHQWGLGESHWLMTPEDLEKLPATFTERFPRGIVSFYRKFHKDIRDPLKIMPTALVEMGDLVLWFELYRGEHVVVKEKHPGDPLVQEIMAQWSKILGAT